MDFDAPVLDVFVPGRPVPGGSKRAFAHAATGKVIVTDDAKGNKQWRERVAFFARQAFARRSPLSGPLRVWVTFTVGRPRSHYRVGRFAHVVKDSAPKHPTRKPDLTKLWRASEDALNEVIWNDDAQIIAQEITKEYGDRPGVRIVVREAN